MEEQEEEEEENKRQKAFNELCCRHQSGTSSPVDGLRKLKKASRARVSLIGDNHTGQTGGARGGETRNETEGKK